MKNAARFLLAASLLGSAVPAMAKPAGAEDHCRDARVLHVASPEWRDQIIYFLMLDRFDDGDPANNDQGMGEYGPKDPSRYSGGDLKGVTKRLDYIQALGATTVWTTPPVANQWWSQEAGYGGYHGYWARDFTRIDEHYGTLTDYQNLSCALHRRGMFHVMDIVVNHMGDFFNYDASAMTGDLADGYRLANPASPSNAPMAHPFNLNDPRRAEDRAAAIYNWTPNLENFYDRQSELTHQLSLLDDINTKSPIVRSAFKEIFGKWIEEGGVDAFRVDTVKYVEPDFFEDFIHAPDGILKRAEGTGRKNFLIFGEVKENAPAFSELGEAKMKLYFGDPTRPTFPSLINFPLQEELIRVLAQGLPTSALRYRLDAFMRFNPDPTLATNFVDNHDVPRFLSQGNLDAFKQALALVFTLPGIPMIYQGNEQAVSETRQAMFKGGYGAERDMFDTRSEMFQFIQKLSAIRQRQMALRRGKLAILADNPNLPGVFAFRRDLNGETIFVILNTAGQRSLLAAMPTGFSADATLTPLLGGDVAPRLSPDGTLSLELAPREIMILSASSLSGHAAKSTPPLPAIRIDGALPDKPLTMPFALSGRFNGSDRALKLVLDGDLDAATEIAVGEDGRWSTVLRVRDASTHKHIARIYAPESRQVSIPIPYTTQRSGADWQASFADPANDDVGFDGTYRAPTDPGFKGQQDIIGASVRAGGDILELELKMRATSADWHPSNGFDHVAFTTFFELPNQTGLSTADDLSAPMPPDFTWSAKHTLFGWGNSMMLQPDRKIGRAPKVKADHDRQTITILFSASSIGLKDWSGVKLYVTTFDRDGDGTLRRTIPAGGLMAFRGQPDGPKIMDDLLIDISPLIERRK